MFEIHRGKHEKESYDGSNNQTDLSEYKKEGGHYVKTEYFYTQQQFI